MGNNNSYWFCELCIMMTIAEPISKEKVVKGGALI